MTPKPWENGEGYPDPAAYNALRPIMQEDTALGGDNTAAVEAEKLRRWLDRLTPEQRKTD